MLHKELFSIPTILSKLGIQELDRRTEKIGAKLASDKRADESECCAGKPMSACRDSAWQRGSVSAEGLPDRSSSRRISFF